ncbi:ubiquitin-conjugating enzyme/RWD-like protein [Aspergillus karnatakaensis]|uniref:putative ubiquitin conjugating enzyme E2 n=1 Tax=Aspergillus karnatakaensis TaxID=1810916 RepID=UPI003CCC9709
MRVSKLRRLAADHAALHEELPPNYLFPPEDSSDDITQLTTLLAGPQGTPYSQGLWRLHLKLPEDYPKSPPKATFRTRIWHPNVEESTGAVCVDTLKRDWKATLTLKDVLITISCLLIYPNPDSALNSTAGALLQENYDAFARQAKLMTSIHAPIPIEMRTEVMEAKTRGEDANTTIPEQEDQSRSLRSRKGTRVQSVMMKKKPTTRKEIPSEDSENNRLEPLSDDENENPATASKENDPTLSPSPVKLAPPLSPRKNAHGKRPLSVLTPSMDIDRFPSLDPDDMEVDMDMNTADGMTASERNIAANTKHTTPIREYHSRDSSPQRKSPKLSISKKAPPPQNLGRLREDLELDIGVTIYEDAPVDRANGYGHGYGRENSYSSSSSSSSSSTLNPYATQKSHQYPSPAHRLALLTSATSTLAKTSNLNPNLLQKPVMGPRKVSSSNGKKVKPRIGIRRL